jgi:F-type H+-transporting ATPase subunit alpha
VVEILKQPQYDPAPVERQVMSIFAVTGGSLDDIPVEDVRRFEAEFLDFMESRHSDIGKQIAESGSLSDEVTEALRAAIKEFHSLFQPSGDHAPLKEGEAQPLTEEEMEALKKFRRPTREEFEQRSGHAGDTSGPQLPG